MGTEVVVGGTAAPHSVQTSLAAPRTGYAHFGHTGRSVRVIYFDVMKCPLNKSQIDRLFHFLEERFGWYFKADGKQFIREHPPETIEAFTDLVLWESGMTPERHPRHRADVHKVVADFFAEATSA